MTRPPRLATRVAKSADVITSTASRVGGQRSRESNRSCLGVPIRSRLATTCFVRRPISLCQGSWHDHIDPGIRMPIPSARRSPLQLPERPNCVSELVESLHEGKRCQRPMAVCCAHGSICPRSPLPFVSELLRIGGRANRDGPRKW